MTDICENFESFFELILKSVLLWKMIKIPMIGIGSIGLNELKTSPKFVR